MTRDQYEALRALDSYLEQATELGVLDLLAEDIGPDAVNGFCDAVTAELRRIEGEEVDQ
jgi:hypothetical protein